MFKEIFKELIHIHKKNVLVFKPKRINQTTYKMKKNNASTFEKDLILPVRILESGRI